LLAQLAVPELDDQISQNAATLDQLKWALDQSEANRSLAQVIALAMFAIEIAIGILIGIWPFAREMESSWCTTARTRLACEKIFGTYLRGHTSTGLSLEASDTACRRRRHRPFAKLSSMSPQIESR
jgi:hypothetical protein